MSSGTNRRWAVDFVRRLTRSVCDAPGVAAGGRGDESSLSSLPRRGWLPGFVVGCLLAAVPAFAQPVDYWAPWVTKLATTSATVNWAGAPTAAGVVEYATTAYYDQHSQTFDKAAGSVTPGIYQHVSLPGLEPNTSYTYQVRPSDKPDAFDKPRTFRTMPVSGPFTFIVISDSHAQEQRYQYVAQAIANEKDVLFILDGGDYASWDAQVDWNSYFTYSDAMLAKFPIFHTIGNHEYHNRADHSGPPTNAELYHGVFDVLPGAPLNYAFDCSGIRFVVLDSPDPDPKLANGDDPQTSLAWTESQVPWLKAQLDNKMAGTFTIHHHPIWDYGKVGSEANLRPWEALYQTYGISANLAGHVHNYQRYSIQGIPYFVLGNGGGVFNDMKAGDPTAPGYQKGKTRELGYLKVTIDPANNTATAEQILVARFAADSDVTPSVVYVPPVHWDPVTFPLSIKSLQSAPVPTLSEWGLLLVGMGLGIAGFVSMRARRPADRADAAADE